MSDKNLQILNSQISDLQNKLLSLLQITNRISELSDDDKTKIIHVIQDEMYFTFDAINISANKMQSILDNKKMVM